MDMDLGGALHLPPGFRFHPTDDELVTHYLCRRCAGLPLFAPVIADVDLYKFDPWQLPEKAAMLGGDAQQKEWYFFSPRDRKYPNGSRPNRAAGTGYWKATGADKPVGSPRPVAIKKALVFYAGKPPKGVKTNWIMHEYRLADVDRSAAARKRTNNALRLDDWVLCRIYNKKGVIERYDTVDDDDVKPAKAKKNNALAAAAGGGAAPMKVETTHDDERHYGSYYDSYDVESPPAAEMLCFDRPFFPHHPPPSSDPSADREDDDSNHSGSVPRMLITHAADRDSSSGGSGSGSEHVLSPSPDLPDRDHAESQPGFPGGAALWFDDGAVVDWRGAGDGDDGFVVDDDGAASFFGPPSPAFFARDAVALGEMLAYLQRPF